MLKRHKNTGVDPDWEGHVPYFLTSNAFRGLKCCLMGLTSNEYLKVYSYIYQKSYYICRLDLESSLDRLKEGKNEICPLLSISVHFS